MNEELQSSNEELEASHEELQSLNEELTTVNNQLQSKVVEVEATNNDLSNLLSSTNIATLFLDPEFRIRRYTPATTRLMHLIPTDLGRAVADIAHRYADGDLVTDCRRVMDDLRALEREVLADDGEWYVRRIQPYRTQDNRIEGTVVTFTNITAMKRRDEEHARLASVVEFSDEAIISQSLAGVVSSWNPGAEALYGYPAEKALGRSAAMLYPKGRTEEFAHTLTELQAGRRVGPYETEHRRKDGTLVQVSITVSPILDASGTPIAASLIGSDATERKEAESALRQRVALQDQLVGVAAAVPGVICSYRQRRDGTACMPYASAAIEDLLGVKSQDVVEDFGPIQAGVHPEDVGQFAASIAQSARTLEPWRAIFRYRHPRKGEIWIEGHSVPRREADGSVLWHGYVQDITERHRMEQALRAKQAELGHHAEVLAQADRRKDEFLAVLGHELRNPLAPIRNAVHLLLRQEKLPEAAQRALDLIARQSEQLETLVNDLLDVSRITRGQIQLSQTAVRVQDVLQDALESVSPLLEIRHCILKARLTGIPVVVTADRLRLAQVFMNLLGNAVKYTPDDGHIDLLLEREGQRAVITIRDDGIGIPAEFIPRLFDFFSRAQTQPGARVSVDGLGIGLAVARQLVEAHGGSLEAHSDGLNKGSEFVVSLPLCADEEATPSAPVEPKSIAEIPSRRVLLVDDNPIVTQSLRYLLESMGQEVRALNAGQEVLRVIWEWNPRLVFLDIDMPKMDGYQVAAAIHAAGLDRRPYLVALTGYGQETDRKAALKAGFDLHLVKPASPEQITKILVDLA